MAGTNLGTAWIQIKPSMKGMTSSIRSELSGVGDAGGAEIGSKFSAGFAAKIGIISGITQQLFTKVTQTITNQLGDAITRADTLTRFPKVMEQMGYSAQVAENAIQKLVKGVEQVPTPLDKVVSGTQQLVSVTRDVDKASDWMLAISDAMLSNSASAEKAEMAVYQFTQILQKGRPVGDDWRSVMEAAPGVMLELAEALGYTSAVMGGDFYTALQKGEVSVEDMMDVLVRMDKEGLNGMQSLRDRAIAASSGIETAMTTMRQSISNAIRDVILDIGVDNIVNAIGNIKDALVSVVKGIGSVINFITENWTVLEPIFTGILSFIGTLLTIVAAQKIFNGISALFSLIATNPLLLVISAIVFAIAELIIHFDEVKATIESVFSGIQQGAQAVWDFITGLFSGLANFFGTIFSNAWNAVKNVFSTGGQIFMGIVDGITEAFRNIVNVIITGINHVVAIPFNAINGFLSFLKGIDILGIKPFDWVGTINVPQIPLLATGGRVFGEGTATSDSVPALLSKGEYVINAATAQQIGYDRLDMLNRTGQMGGDQTINITINGYNKSPEELANIISRKIAFNQRGVIG